MYGSRMTFSACVHRREDQSIYDTQSILSDINTNHLISILILVLHPLFSKSMQSTSAKQIITATLVWCSISD
ncbi:hypothetical protein SERLADRAFT_384030, partial [Serpula lacrymans var. lacrymans S7.9]